MMNSDAPPVAALHLRVMGRHDDDGVLVSCVLQLVDDQRAVLRIEAVGRLVDQHDRAAEQ